MPGAHSCARTHSHTHSLTLVHSLTHSLTHSLMHACMHAAGLNAAVLYCMFALSSRSPSPSPLRPVRTNTTYPARFSQQYADVAQTRLSTKQERKTDDQFCSSSLGGCGCNTTHIHNDSWGQGPRMAGSSRGRSPKTQAACSAPRRAR